MRSQKHLIFKKHCSFTIVYYIMYEEVAEFYSVQQKSAGRRTDLVINKISSGHKVGHLESENVEISKHLKNRISDM